MKNFNKNSYKKEQETFTKDKLVSIYVLRRL